MAEELSMLTEADTHLFLVGNDILKTLGTNDLGTLQDLKDAMEPKGSDSLQDKLRNVALHDFRTILANWDESKANINLGGSVDERFGSARRAGQNAGIAAFLEHSKAKPRSANTTRPFPHADGLSEFVAHVEQKSMVLQSIIILYLESIYKSYCEYLWSDEMKITIVRLSTYADAEIYEYLSGECERFASHEADVADLLKVQEMIQMLFELHLDIHMSITNPGSMVNVSVRVQERDRLARWLTLAGDMQEAFDKTHLPLELELRYHWSRTYFAHLTQDEGAGRAHMISLWADQRAILSYANNASIELQNNAAMPEISVAAADREISRLTSVDLFMNLFSTDQSDPCAIIRTLEPVLDPSCVQRSDLAAENTGEADDDTQSAASLRTSAHENLPHALRDMWKFLEGSSASLRMFLWTRLREAYQGINYTTKVFSCHLKSIEILMADLRSQAYVDAPLETRHNTLLVWIHTIDDLLVKALTIALNDSTAYDIIDEKHIKSTGSALAQLSRILHCAAIFDDESRAGFMQMPRKTLAGFINKLKEMQVRTWALQYTVIKDGMAQNPHRFKDMDISLAEYMAAVHYALGLRKWCKASNKIFLKMMKLEMVRLKHVQFWEDYLGQVLYDLYGIKLGAGVYEIRDHGCTTEPLDRRTTHQLLPLIITLANRMPIKDLLKSELRPTIERMQQAIGATKSTPLTTHNLRNYLEYLKGYINPIKLYEALKGQVQGDLLPVVGPDASIADQGWFFLQGNIAYTKFKSQKKLSPGAQDDLKIAASFFRLQIQFTPEHWETWYKLAQCFDADLDEDVLWSAEKMNDAGSELIRLQRSSIQCYIMAISTAARKADATFDTSSKLSDLYRDFAMRMYASSREPFKMGAFYLDGFDKHFSAPDQSMYKSSPHEELTKHKAWRYAAALFKRALVEKPDDWILHHMYGKCLWKMYHQVPGESDASAKAKPSVPSIIRALKKAVATVPKPRDSRQEPILEPHYKLLSIVHKLVSNGDLKFQAGADILQDNRPYAIKKGEQVLVACMEEWEEYVSESLRHLRSTDKANWHHRMIARSAYIVHDPNTHDQDAESATATAARNILCQTMFTRTMVVNVWKPDYERPGRHFVYMERYVRYMIKLLVITNEKTQLDLLAKRIRKRPGDYYRFSEVWNECCSALYKLIRRQAKIPTDRDEAFKTVTREDFALVSDRLNAWIATPNNTHPALEGLREVIELKKLNAGAMKTAPLDDLINDAWAVIYFAIGVHLPDSAAPSGRPGPMSLAGLVNIDGSNEVSGGGVGPDSSRTSKLGISRREILRQAESAVTRVPELAARGGAHIVSNQSTNIVDRPRRVMDPSMILPSNAPSPPVGADSRIVISIPSSTQVSTPGFDRDTEMKDAEPDTAGPDDKAGRAPSSEPGSVHDSADDESDLSDVPNMDDEDDVEIFPYLARPSGPARPPLNSPTAGRFPLIYTPGQIPTRPARPNLNSSTAGRFSLIYTPGQAPTGPARPPLNSPADGSLPLVCTPEQLATGRDNRIAVYRRPPTVRGFDKLNPIPVGNDPPWHALPQKGTVMSRDGSKCFSLNETVWLSVLEPGFHPDRNVGKLARILDIRTARNQANEEVDLFICSWYWYKQEVTKNPEFRISRLASQWPDNTPTSRCDYMLSNHRDILTSKDIIDRADDDVLHTICASKVLFCDGTEPEIELLLSLIYNPAKREWLERGWLNPAGVVP